MLENHLIAALGDSQVLTSITARYAFANDAGPYLLIPEVVLQPQTEADIQRIFALATTHRRPVVFRAGGTSLSGQSITDGWLVDIGRHWRAIEPLDRGCLVRVQPGAIGGMVNRRLHPYGRKIGPDPSSIMSAMMGGILSNNSSGMCCGVKNNAYHTLRGLRFILLDGSVWDTSRTGEHARFEQEQATLSSGLCQLRDEVRKSSALTQKIRHKYQQKNTVGYSLNAFLDHDHPLDIFAHLLVGAEGTLAFISEAILETLPELPQKATGLAYFNDVLAACASIPWFTQAGCQAVELMDHASLASIRELEGVPEELPNLLDTHRQVMAILFEFQAADAAGLAEQLEAFRNTIEPKLSPLQPIAITQQPKQQYAWWKLRKGMYPAVAAVRGRGEAAILEDIAVPVDQLGPAILELQGLFRRHHYENGIIFGHAKDGNLHFVITQSLSEARDIEKYSRFIDDMVAMVVERYDGALKAEHGTGRNMAPFVETEWGTEAIGLMRRLKKLVDPLAILNPDVILTATPSLHTRNLKDLPVVEDVVDKCIECGACEPRCPSRDFTLSPRQRIVVRRAMARLGKSGDKAKQAALEREYLYEGLQSCATDGLCAVDCPVAINTGELVKQLRSQRTGGLDQRLARWLARHFATAERLVHATLHLGTICNRLGNAQAMSALTRRLRWIFPGFPYWHPSLTAGGRPRNEVFPSAAEWLYLPACMSRMMGGTAPSLMEVARRAGYRLYLPQASLGMCCGQAFSSKGYLAAAVDKQSEWIDQAWQLSHEGALPIVTDLGSCSAFLRQRSLPLAEASLAKYQRLRIYDSVEFAHDYILPRLELRRRLPVVAVHSVCSNHKMGLEDKLLQVAAACAERVITPHAGQCCGMGGDRGFALPGLTEAATAGVRKVMGENGCDRGYTTARSCAISLSSGSGRPWGSLFDLLEEVSREEGETATA
jgi:D-lactate dehydrogenase